MKLDDLQRQWNELAERDALWAVLTDPNKKDRQWNPEEFFATGREEVARTLEEMLRFGMKPSPRSSVLDFGCGVGRLSQALAHHFDHVTGVDLAPAMIEQARHWNRAGERCRYVQNSAGDLSVFSSATFDLVYTNIVLQHIPPRLSENYIREFLRVLRPGGLLFFQMTSHPSATLVGRLLRLLPAFLVRPFRGLDMYGIRQDRVRAIVESAGGAVVGALPDGGAGPHWVSFRYFVARNTINKPSTSTA